MLLKEMKLISMRNGCGEPRCPSVHHQHSVLVNTDPASTIIFLMHSMLFYQDNIPNKWTRIQPGQDKCPHKSSRPIHWCFIQRINGTGATERLQKCRSLLQLLRQRRRWEDGRCWGTTDAAILLGWWCNAVLSPPPPVWIGVCTVVFR